jgi:3-hydroxyisobutyrate dehydrogenase-like beta-hydroxyacid dehydrogenase
MRIGILHSGAMGASIGLSLLASGHELGWVSEGCSADSRNRAKKFEPFTALDEMAVWADGIISICPPDAAIAQAQSVYATAFDGLYVDANAIAPNNAKEIAQIFGAGAYVDGGIIGPPALSAGTTRLYLSGLHAASVASWFSQGFLQAIALPESDHANSMAAASALKMAYAAHSKGSSALLLAVNALAASIGISDALKAEWDISQPGLNQRSDITAKVTSPKAWRFGGEMLEISETFEAQGLSGDFHQGAADIFASMADLKDKPGADLDQVIAQILGSGGVPDSAS